ncbi:DedA family protein [Actinotalea solisilvae]|uniref:DedA family protein n=1 Tax=Actinotalea solisilvae TaxID=2072922 RepID=UPI0018F1BCCE|nr:VTT domain-containing protein [Actinotalea solisilvae]
MPGLEAWAAALADSPWALVVLLAAVTADGLVPPVPSESVVIALAALAASTGSPDLRVLVAVAALGAFAGDQLAYAVGRRVPVERVRLLRTPRARQALAWAAAALEQRGAAFLVGARFVPVGRVAANLTAGSVGYSRRRFTLVTAVAAVTWSASSVALGVGAGRALAEHHPLLGVLAGVAVGLVVGTLVDAVLRVLLRVRDRAAPRLPRPPVPVGAAGVGGRGDDPVARRPTADGRAASPAPTRLGL